jgi:lathosterol oxidase
MKTLLFSVIIASFFFAVLSFLSHRKHWALIAISISVLTIVIGGFNVEARAVEKTNWHLGLDWLLIDLLLMAIIFVPIEYVLPKNLNQTNTIYIS